LSELVLERLLDADEKTLALLPRLAKSWSVSKDFRRITFWINPQARWSDGKPVTAEDVRFTFEFIGDKKRNPSFETFHHYLGEVESTSVSGDSQKIEFKLARSHAENLRRLGEQFILPSHIYGKLTSEEMKSRRDSLIGSGPYLLDQVGGVVTIQLQKNSNWWSSKERTLRHLKNAFQFDRIALRAITGEAQAYQMFQSRLIDILYLRGENLKKWRELNDLQKADARLGGVSSVRLNPWVVSGLSVNLDHPQLKEAGLRTALQLLIPADEIKEQVYFNLAKTPASILPPIDTKNSESILHFDPSQSRDILEKLGYTQKDADGIWFRKHEKLSKERLEFVVSYLETEETSWLELFQKKALENGVKINLVSQRLGEAAMVAMSWVMGAVPDLEPFFCGSIGRGDHPLNPACFNHKKLESLLGEMNREPSPLLRKKKTQIFSDHFSAEQLFLFAPIVDKHTILYWKDVLVPSDPPFAKYSGDETINPFFLKWRQKSPVPRRLIFY
jgi:ABC-type transport system substrate-binding protein